MAIGVLTLTPSAPSATSSFGHQAIINGFHLHGGLVSFDFGDHITGIDFVAFL